MSTKSTEKAFVKVGELAATYMQEYLASNDINATGNLSKSIKVTSTSANDIIDVSIEMPEYGKFVDEGRKGKGPYDRRSYKKGDGFPPLDAISKWIQQKPISPKAGISQNSLAFLIGKKIYEKGIKPKPFIEMSIEKAIEDSEDAVFEAMDNDIGFTIEESFKKTNVLK